MARMRLRVALGSLIALVLVAGTVAGPAPAEAADPATAPQVWVSTPVVNLGAPAPGQSSSHTSIPIKNTGGGPATNFTVQPAVPATFTAEAVQCAPDLQVNVTCWVAVTFTPTDAAGTTTGSVEVTWDGGSTTISLTGEAGQPTTPLVTPTSLDFGDVSQYQSSPPLGIDVVNRGTTTLTGISLGGFSDDRFARDKGCTALAPGASCEFIVVFHATSPPPADATATLTTSEGDTTIHLRAAFRPPPLAGVDDYTTQIDTPLVATTRAQGILGNDTGRGLRVGYHTALPAGMVLYEDGTFAYTPKAAFHGIVSFDYTARDAVNGGSSVRVTIHVVCSPSQAFLIAAFTDFVNRAPTDAELRQLAAALDGGMLTPAAEVKSLSNTGSYVKALVDKLYLSTLGRSGDAAGLDYWVNQIRTRARTVAQVAAYFYASREYFDTKGGGTNSSWVTDLYQKLLGRAPDAAGLDYWVGQVTATSRTSVALRFFQSSESAHARVKALYRALLGRDPDPAGWDYWAAQIPSRGDLALAANLASSDEYYARAHSRFP